MVDTKKQETRMIISLSVILNYIHYCHPNKKCNQGTRLYVVANVAYLTKIYIHRYYHVVIIILNSLKISSKMLKTEGLGEKQIAYMKHIKIQSFHMGFIFTPNHMTRQRQQCVHTHSQIMCYHNENVYCDVVPNVQALIFLTRKQMIIILTPVLKFVFTFII